MLSNILKDRVQLQEKTITQGALGQTVVWKPTLRMYAKVIPLDVQARAVYQQLNSYVTHEVIFRGSVDISLGDDRILHGSKTYEPIEPAMKTDYFTIVICKEI